MKLLEIRRYLKLLKSFIHEIRQQFIINFTICILLVICYLFQKYTKSIDEKTLIKVNDSTKNYDEQGNFQITINSFFVC